MPSKNFPRERQVNINRYMGPWYVIAHIPPSVTKNSYDSIERYTKGKENRIKVDFTYREGSFDGKKKEKKPTGFILPGTGNAVWAMEFFWPLKLQYVISYVSPDYKTTIVAREKRDYVWIMARTPSISDSTYQKLVDRVKNLGYDTSKLRRVPQQPLSQRDDL
ncbi:MAG: lipocalin family protein [Salinisphaera sp.]|nr:lipocalin family protein [Salinisphaera sp.]